MGLLASLSVEFFAYYKAILARAMFGTHALVAVWRTTVVMGVVYWTLTMGVFFLAVEYIVTMWVRMGKEWPWISPSTLCYLLTTASALWIQKLENLGHVQSTNGSLISTLPAFDLQLDFSASDWLLLTEQTMMVTIILSRWLLPKGEMSNKDLSSLLLLYLGLSADIMDFSTIFNEPKVAADVTICYVILVVWTGSLAQFVLVLTNTTKVEKESVKLDMKSLVCSSEIWQILVQVGLQDLPFLLIRVMALTTYQVFNYTIIFFVCKNTLVITLEVFHLVALCLEQRRKLKKRRERMKQLKSKMQAKVSTFATLGRFKNPLQTQKNEDGNDAQKDKANDTDHNKSKTSHHSNDSGISATSTPKTAAKSSIFSLATKKIQLNKADMDIDAAKPKKKESSIAPNVLNNNRPTSGDRKDSDKSITTEEMDTETKRDTTPGLKTGSSLARRVNDTDKISWNDNLLFKNDDVLTRKFPKFDGPKLGTPPLSHLQTNRVHSPLATSFDSNRPRYDYERQRTSSTGSNSVNRQDSSSSASGVTVSSVFDVDDSVF